ncbi:MAG: transporter substrate-binding protein, partial [Anaeromyxobacteraceae bacterium]
MRRTAVTSTLVRLALAVALAPAALSPATARAAETVKVGVLHSLSGTMAISETALKDVALMTIEEINASGGVLGKKVEAVVVDPASNWPLFAEKARQLVAQDKVAAVFGCWTSVSRKSVLPVFKELNGLLFYPVQYEGEELEKNVFYTGAAPNQQAIPAVEYLMSEEGGGAKRFFLLGTDYVYPRTTNKILRAFLKSKGIADADIMEEYTPFGHSDYQTIIAKIKKFSSEGKKTAVISTINGDSNVPFYKELGNAGLKAKDVPVVVDPASNWPLFAEKAKQLIGQDKVAVTFGCWTSVSRKSVLPVVEEMNGLLFYPVQYEGEELSKNVFYTGAAPNQQAIPAVEYLMSKDGGGAKRFVLLGTDYVYPRTTNKILRAFLK